MIQIGNFVAFYDDTVKEDVGKSGEGGYGVLLDFEDDKAVIAVMTKEGPAHAQPLTVSWNGSVYSGYHYLRGVPREFIREPQHPAYSSAMNNDMWAVYKYLRRFYGMETPPRPEFHPG